MCVDCYLVNKCLTLHIHTPIRIYTRARRNTFLRRSKSKTDYTWRYLVKINIRFDENYVQVKL